ncbi:Tyrosine-protein kinase wzc [Roseivivax jejudonensis]|uniref:non-specific protein-tyrosine kinase n=1 Tax=Roseivivax jejudonensis TaxID=1529041 RepID=A0A1X7AA04_9RHOB|nr:polysaccharide biosynthesis tyrosine autokinase [Roseivivax jejudonensis]SLN74181.1 Tyrosine-protein kinase wzc [Roseivivax jejudonensis]
MLEKPRNVTATQPYQPPAQEDDEIDLLEIAGTLWRGKWIIAGCAAVAALIGGYQAFVVAEPKYAATTSLALQLRNEQVVDIESVVSGVSTEDSSINTELEVIRSRSLIEELVSTLDLTNDPEFNSALRPEPDFAIRPIIGSVVGAVRGLVGDDAAAPTTTAPTGETISEEERTLNRTVNAVRSAVSATNQRNTYVFNVRAQTGDPMKSARIANTLSELYIQNQIDVKFQATENAVTWLSERVVDLEGELEDQQAAVKNMRADMELSSPEALEGLNQQLRDIRARLADARSTASVQTARIDRISDLRDAGAYEDIAGELDDPTLNRIVDDAVAGDTDAQQLFETRLDTLTARLTTNASRSSQQAEALSASYDDLQQRFNDQSQQFSELQQLERELQSTRTLYETFLTRLKETSVQRGLQQADSRLLSRATPGTYVEPRKSRIVALSLILGLMVGAAIVMGRQFLHRGFRTSEDLEAETGLPILGQIPKIPIRKRGQLVDYLNRKPTSAASEAIRNLRTSVLLSDIDNPPQIIMSTSALPGEGKTTQAIALAHNLAGLGRRVLLVEGDIRRRTFGEYFGKDRAAGGVIAAMTGTVPFEECVIRDEAMNADIMMAERTSANAADLFSSDRFRDFLGSLRDSYDFIVVDTPPVLVVPDARIVSQYTDAVLFTVAWDRTSKTQVAEALRQFRSVNTRVNGLVLAQIDPRGMRRYGYGGKYGAYAAYGSNYYTS